MNSDIILPMNGHEAVHENGAHEQFLLSGEDENILNQADEVSDIAVLNATLDNTTLGEEHDDGSKILQEGEEAKRVDSKPSRKNVKAMATAGPKKSKDGKHVDAVASMLNPKQHAKSNSFNDRQVRSHASKPVAKPNTAGSEVVREQVKLMPSKKENHNKQDGDSQSTESPTAEDAKPRRAGALPNYGFSFKCDERAEKRREFYTKLEEKIHAKEVEKSNLQAKSKETQEAEIKLLRKSLTFKATPMPNFYQEPTPPKTELKKIPTTRARSPKLGRRKTLGGGESEDNSGRSHQSGRFSLDSVARNNSTKVSSPAITKKPVQKSLTKLVSVKASQTGVPSKAVKSSKPVDKEEKAPNSVGTEEKSVASDEASEPASFTQGQEQIQEAEPTEIRACADNVPETIAVELAEEH